jgi:choline dehydrogenase-like flavoprotein
VALIDARALPPGATIEAHVCVVGAGAAGIALARELSRSGLDVCLLESGGLGPEPGPQDLARGEIAGAPYCPLDANRARQLGGTTGLWAGWCRPLDDSDFQARAWVPDSGWPLGREELRPYYRRAGALCELPPSDGDPEAGPWRPDGMPLPLDPERIVTRVYRLSPPTRFGQVYRPELAASRHARVLLHATAIELETDGPGESVTCVRAAAATRPFAVKARHYVLAGGGIENARLLLASRRTAATGLGNAHGLVGRYFMEHVHFHSGYLALAPAWRRRAALYAGRGRAEVGRFFVSPRAQEREGLLNWTASLERWRPDRAAAAAWLRGEGRARPRWRELLPGTLRLHETIEPLPNPDSRVTLGPERDALGMPRVRLDWRPSPEERTTSRRARALLDQALRQAGLGRIVATTGDDDAWPPPRQGTRGHHMGTTRMSADPRRGVVDPRCRVHGVRNLYVAGSSVFPTGGAGTPTLTLLALALRLADHLAAARP